MPLQADVRGSCKKECRWLLAAERTPGQQSVIKWRSQSYNCKDPNSSNIKNELKSIFFPRASRWEVNMANTLIWAWDPTHWTQSSPLDFWPTELWAKIQIYFLKTLSLCQQKSNSYKNHRKRKWIQPMLPNLRVSVAMGLGMSFQLISIIHFWDENLSWTINIYNK